MTPTGSAARFGTTTVQLARDDLARFGGGKVFALYLALYATGRLWIEGLRMDDASELFGFRLNQYVMVPVLVGSIAYFVRRAAAREPAQDLRGAQAQEHADPAS